MNLIVGSSFHFDEPELVLYISLNLFLISNVSERSSFAV